MRSNWLVAGGRCLLIASLFVFGEAARAGQQNPPTVTVTYPNTGETLVSGTTVPVSWIASDDSGFIVRIDVYVSLNGGATWQPIALELFEGNSVDWVVPNRPTTTGLVRVAVLDPWLNSAEDVSDTYFSIVSGPVGLLPTTLRDFDLPGTQPLETRPLNDPVACSGCHGYYDPNIAIAEKYFGSMMAYASIDPIFNAAREINNNEAPESGDLCLRCHVAAGWLQGRSQPTDGSGLLHSDLHGVSCDLCHRLVDPFYDVENPIEDVDILNDLTTPVPSIFGNAMYIVDPDDFRRRGPFSDALQFHGILVSPFHREAALCGTCHDVSNPLLDKQKDGTFALNAFDTAPASAHPGDLMAEQRTYSEWFFSAFNSPQGVYAPEFGGNRDYVATCQDCHMRDVTGRGCFSMEAPLRNDMPLHDLTGGNAWLLGIMDQVDPNIFPEHLDDGVARTRYLLHHAAELDAQVKESQLDVTVTNKTGHKLPTGYPEGRRMWLNVKFFNSQDELVGESGAYDPDTAVLTLDPEVKVYEGKPVISPTMAQIVGYPAYTSFHFVLNDMWLKDNRIPPLGFTNAAYEAVNAAPVGATYADGQNWDVTAYSIPSGAVRAEVRLLYQTMTKEYIEFLRDYGSMGGPGQFAYDLWESNDKAPPELMRLIDVSLVSSVLGDMNCDGIVTPGDIAGFVLALTNPAQYAVQYPNCNINNADTNEDGVVSPGDISGFVAILTGG